MTMRGLWRPIAELTDLYTQPLMIASPKLIDLDSNPEGISEGFWQDDQGEYLDPPAPGTPAWKTLGYDMCNDEWYTRTLAREDVTHFIIPEGPWTTEEAERLQEKLYEESGL